MAIDEILAVKGKGARHPFVDVCDFHAGVIMPRAARAFEEGRIYHVYNRVGGGWAPFADEWLAQVFVDLLREVATRDRLQILGWSLLGNHYHLIIRQGPVDISRPMKTLQQRTTRVRNLRDRVYGSLWQGRFKAKDVATSSYLPTLLWTDPEATGCPVPTPAFGGASRLP